MRRELEESHGDRADVFRHGHPGLHHSMGPYCARFEVTAKYAKAYAKVAKKDKGRLLDEVVAVTGWSRDNARRRLAAAAKPRPRAMKVARKRRARKYSYDATVVLQKVWAASGGQCGKYLAASMRLQLDGLERHGELTLGVSNGLCKRSI